MKTRTKFTALARNRSRFVLNSLVRDYSSFVLEFFAVVLNLLELEKKTDSDSSWMNIDRKNTLV